MIGRSAPLILILVASCAAQDWSEHRRPGAIPTIRPERRLPIPPAADPRVEGLATVPLLRLRGDAYTRGVQYGRAFGAEWEEAVAGLEDAAARAIRPYIGSETIARVLYRAATNQVFNQVDDAVDPDGSLRRMPSEDRAYVQGLADGAGLSLAALTRLIATVMLSDGSCCGFIAFGPATADGRLIQLRNLDWGDEGMQPQRATILLVHEPPGGARYLSIGFVGLIGTVSGINEHGISLTEIGAESACKTRRGRPMPLLLEHVLARARNLEEAIKLFEEAPGTGGYNFLVGSARERRGAVIEKNAERTAVFRIAANSYEKSEDFVGFEGFDCRADNAADPRIRATQTCSGGKPGAAGSPSARPVTARGSGPYTRRYLPQIELFRRFGGRLSIARAEQIAARTAPDDNLHSILYDFERGRVYLRNKAWARPGAAPVAVRELRAAVQAPVVIDLRVVFPGQTFAPNEARR